MKQKLLLILICLWGLRAAAAGSLYFGYSYDYVHTGVGKGTGKAEELSAAICMPASLSGLYAGKTITKIRLGIGSGCSNISSVWIKNSLTGAYVFTQAVNQSCADWNWVEVTLSTPFTIPANDFYIGYTATGLYPIGFSGTAKYDGCWFNDGQWRNETKYGSVCIQALIDAQSATILAMEPESLQNGVQSAQNKNFTLPCTVKSYSSVDITNVKVSYQINNQTRVEKTIQTLISPMKSGSINIPIDAIATNGIYQISVKILEINGQANVFAGQSLSTEFRILSQSFPRKVVIEEGTGTWCGWCIRGAVGMALMKEKYPATFIGIAVHHGDPMALTEYDNLISNLIGYSYPGAVVDRKSYMITDPYPDYGADAAFQSEIAKIPVAGIQLSGGFTDANKTAISLKTVSTFGISSGNANFKLAYVLIENGVTGYDQANYYAGGGMGVMGGYENKPATVTDMVFNDLARGIYSDPAGIAGSIPGSITAMTPIEHTYKINLPSSIQNKTQLEVAVLLINGNTGEIENADLIKISGVYTDLPVFTSVNKANVWISNQNLYIESDVSETIDIYNISGVKIYHTEKKPGTVFVSLERLPEGILIVKGSSGWVKKVIC